jgi:tRNA pseudouridine55 synthase
VSQAEGVVVVDKPAGWTSHDVVARVRKLAATRRVGHAGTLDPMATGVLVLGLGKGTRLLGHLALTDKEYTATIRLGQATTTDDAEGEVLGGADATAVDDAALHAGIDALTGTIEQIPPQVSAVKVAGRRAYAAARAGEEVALKARTATVSAFDVQAVRRTEPGRVDIDARIVCSTGTYIRALARDLGDALAVGGHLTALRRTRVGHYRIDQARPLADLEGDLGIVPLSDAVAAAFPVRALDEEEARRVRHGNRIAAAEAHDGPVGLFGPDGAVLALAEDRSGLTQPIVVFG